MVIMKQVPVSGVRVSGLGNLDNYVRNFFPGFGRAAASSASKESCGEGCNCSDKSGVADKNVMGTRSTWRPATDIYSDGDGYVFRMEVPGFSRDDFTVEVEDDLLSVKGKGAVSRDSKGKDPEGYIVHRAERRRGDFYRAFWLPGDCDGSKIKASMKDGILELKVPKAEEKKARQISIG